MDHVAQKAAQTRRFNTERRKSIISISDNSTPEPAATVSPPETAAMKKPSLADFYRKRTQRTATTPGTNDLAATPVTNKLAATPVTDDRGSTTSSTPPRLDSNATATQASTETLASRPILPPKNQTKKSPQLNHPHVPGTPYARSASGRPYDMVTSMLPC